MMAWIKSLEEKFWDHVDKNGPVPEHCPELGPCWIWTGKTRKDWGAYGIIEEVRDGKAKWYRSHRVSWEIHFGPIPDGKSVLHKCDNSNCPRPDHLFLGTRAENMADKMAKGRYVSGMKGKHQTERHHAAMIRAGAVRRGR